MKKKINYITNDLSSPHSLKRKSWFIKHKFKYQLYGGINLSNSSILSIEHKGLYKFKSGIKYYPFRLIKCFFLVIKNYKSFTNANINIVRGIEYAIIFKILNLKFVYEYTDIHNYILKFKFLSFFEKLFIDNNLILVTSEGFDKKRNFKSKLITWHNDPYQYSQNKDFRNIFDEILYAGYLRGIEKLELIFNKGFKIHTYGKKNIKYQDYRNLIGYKGEYNFSEISLLYSKYIFSYVSDFYTENSNYNLTNRIYESILNFTIPIELNYNSYQYNFLKKNNIFFITEIHNIKDFNKLSSERKLEIFSDNYNKLVTIINKDNAKICQYFNKI